MYKRQDMDWTVDQGGYFENTRDACGCGNPMAVYVEGTKQSFDKGVAMHCLLYTSMHLRKKILSVVLAGAMIGGELVTGIGSFTLPVNAADSSLQAKNGTTRLIT